MPVFTTRAYVALPWNYTEIETCPQGRPQDLVPLFHIDRELRHSPLPHPLTLDGLAADNLYWIGKRRCGGCINCFLYVLVSLSQEDWVREASLFFPVYTAYLAELHTQNRFHDHDLDGLQYQLRSADMVRS
jgi:hypothetical protein